MDRGASALRVGVVVASLGRPEELAILLTCLSKQTQAPIAIVLALAKESDVPGNATNHQAKIVFGNPGLPAQRNRGLDAIACACDIVVFFDDDFVPSRSAIKGIADVFARHPDVVGLTGSLLADGVTQGGVSPEEAMQLVESFDQKDALAEMEITPRRHGLYGCNMAYRVSAIADLRFDEALPLYGWQEDMDFSARVGRRGRLVKANTCVGVHCGVTKSRSPGLRLGYSQIANPTYLVGKGTMRLSFALQLMARNLISNHAKSFMPEPWVDRKGRMVGNWLALRDLLLGRLRPNRILELGVEQTPTAGNS